MSLTGIPFYRVFPRFSDTYDAGKEYTPNSTLLYLQEESVIAYIGNTNLTSALSINGDNSNAVERVFTKTNQIINSNIYWKQENNLFLWKGGKNWIISTVGPTACFEQYNSTGTFVPCTYPYFDRDSAKYCHKWYDKYNLGLDWRDGLFRYECSTLTGTYYPSYPTSGYMYWAVRGNKYYDSPFHGYVYPLIPACTSYALTGASQYNAFPYANIKVNYWEDAAPTATYRWWEGLNLTGTFYPKGTAVGNIEVGPSTINGTVFAGPTSAGTRITTTRHRTKMEFWKAYTFANFERNPYSFTDNLSPYYTNETFLQQFGLTGTRPFIQNGTVYPPGSGVVYPVSFRFNGTTAYTSYDLRTFYYTNTYNTTSFTAITGYDTGVPGILPNGNYKKENLLQSSYLFRNYVNPPTGPAGFSFTNFYGIAGNLAFNISGVTGNSIQEYRLNAINRAFDKCGYTYQMELPKGYSYCTNGMYDPSLFNWSGNIKDIFPTKYLDQFTYSRVPAWWAVSASTGNWFKTWDRHARSSNNFTACSLCPNDQNLFYTRCYDTLNTDSVSKYAKLEDTPAKAITEFWTVGNCQATNCNEAHSFKHIATSTSYDGVYTLLLAGMHPNAVVSSSIRQRGNCPNNTARGRTQSDYGEYCYLYEWVGSACYRPTSGIGVGLSSCFVADYPCLSLTSFNTSTDRTNWISSRGASACTNLTYDCCNSGITKYYLYYEALRQTSPVSQVSYNYTIPANPYNFSMTNSNIYQYDLWAKIKTRAAPFPYYIINPASSYVFYPPNVWPVYTYTANSSCEEWRNQYVRELLSAYTFPELGHFSRWGSGEDLFNAGECGFLGYWPTVNTYGDDYLWGEPWSEKIPKGYCVPVTGSCSVDYKIPLVGCGSGTVPVSTWPVVHRFFWNYNSSDLDTGYTILQNRKFDIMGAASANVTTLSASSFTMQANLTYIPTSVYNYRLDSSGTATKAVPATTGVPIYYKDVCINPIPRFYIVCVWSAGYCDIPGDHPSLGEACQYVARLNLADWWGYGCPGLSGYFHQDMCDCASGGDIKGFFYVSPTSYDNEIDAAAAQLALSTKTWDATCWNLLHFGDSWCGPYGTECL